MEREKSGLMKEEKDSDEYEEYRVIEFKEDKEVKWNKRKGKEESNVPKGKCDGNRKGKERKGDRYGKGKDRVMGREMRCTMKKGKEMR